MHHYHIDISMIPLSISIFLKDFLSISIFFRIALSISISIFSKLTISIFFKSVDISTIDIDISNRATYQQKQDENPLIKLLVGVPVPLADLPEIGRWVVCSEGGIPRDGLPCTRNTESSSEPPKTRSDQFVGRH